MSFEEYDKSTGEPAGIQVKIWNGELCDYQRTQLKKLYKIKDSKEQQKIILELIKSTYHMQNEFRKASFYKDEFDGMCNFLDNLDSLSISEEKQKVTDEFGKEHDHVLNTKRSLVKSIPQLRSVIQG